MVGSGERKTMVSYLRESYQVSITRACKAINFSKSMYYFESVKDDSEVVAKLEEYTSLYHREGQDA